MRYDEAQAIIINKRENDFRNDATIFAEQIAGDDALNAALLRFHCAAAKDLVNKAFDLADELARIETHYATHNIEEEIGLLLIENGGERDELNEWY